MTAINYIVEVQLACEEEPIDEIMRLEVLATDQEHACEEALLLATSLSPALYSGHKCVKFGLAPEGYIVVSSDGKKEIRHTFISYARAMEALNIDSEMWLAEPEVFEKYSSRMYDVVNGKDSHLYHYITAKMPKVTLPSKPRMLPLNQ